MASKLGICNGALIRLGAPIIADFTSSDIAVSCDTIYSGIRDMLIAMHPWRFATAKRQLAQLVDTPLNEWTYAYQLPSDAILAPHAVFRDAVVGAQPFQDFEIFENKLYTDATTIIIDYRYAPSEGNWPPWFVELVTLAMTGAMAMPVTQNDGLASEWNQRAFGTYSENGMGGYFGVCALQNAQANPPIQIRDFSLVDARFG